MLQGLRRPRLASLKHTATFFVIALMVNRTYLDRRLGANGVLPSWRELLLGPCLGVLVGGYLDVAVHEFGHAAAVRAVKATLLFVHVGSGPALLTRRVRGVELVLRVRPAGGMTGFQGARTTARRAIVAAAGPLADAAMAALCFLVAVTAPHQVGAVVLVFGLQSALALPVSLSTRPPPPGQHGSDGWMLRQLWRGRGQDPAVVAARHRLTDVFRESGRGVPGPALAFFDELAPTASPALLQWMAEARPMVLSQAGRFEEALAALDELLVGLAPDDHKAHLLSVARAYAVLSLALAKGHLLTGDQLTPEEVAACAAAIAAAPQELLAQPGFAHTHAMQLLVQGRVADATILLHQVQPQISEPADRAYVDATLVLAAALAGDLAEARRWLEQVPVECRLHSAAAHSVLALSVEVS